VSTIFATAGGTLGSTDAIGGARFVAAVTSGLVIFSEWTDWPVISRNMIAPSDQRSVRPSISPVEPRACSGAMNAGVPTTVPVRVVSVMLGSLRRATPKSSTVSACCVVQKRLSGFRSRWTMPCAWAVSRMPSTWDATHRISGRGSLPPIRLARTSTGSPWSRSMTR